MSPLAFLLRRVGAGALTVLAVASLSFVAIHALPGDPADMLLDETASAADRLALRAALHLDDPLPLQYVRFLGDLFLQVGLDG